MISEPEIRIHDILQHDRFFVMATMSLWEVLGPEEVIEIINDHELKDYGSTSEAIYHRLKETAVSEGQSVDDITLIISHLC